MTALGILNVAANTALTQP